MIANNKMHRSWRDGKRRHKQISKAYNIAITQGKGTRLQVPRQPCYRNIKVASLAYNYKHYFLIAMKHVVNGPILEL